MTGDPRYRGYPAPVVQVDGGQANWQTIAVLGMLTMQFCFLMLIAWRLMLAPADSGDQQREQLAALQQSIDRLAEVQRERTDVEARTRVLDRIVSQWQGTPEGLVGSLAEKTSEVEELRGNVRAHQALEKELESRIETTQSMLARAEFREQRLKDEVESLHENIGKLENAQLSAQEEVTSLKQRLGSDGADEGNWSWRNLHWSWIVLGAALGMLAVGGVVATVLKQKYDEESSEDTEESSPETNG